MSSVDPASASPAAKKSKTSTFAPVNTLMLTYMVDSAVRNSKAGVSGVIELPAGYMLKVTTQKAGSANGGPAQVGLYDSYNKVHYSSSGAFTF